MSTGAAYLESGETIVLTADRVSIDSVTSDAMLTTRRLILIDSSTSRFEPRATPLALVRTVRSGRAATGEPAIILTLAGEGETGGTQMSILFLQEPLENRSTDRDLWLKTFIELSVSSRKSSTPLHAPPAVHQPGMQPSVRRWVAPDITRPRSENFPEKPRSPPPEIHEDASFCHSQEEPQPEPSAEPAREPAAGPVPEDTAPPAVPDRVPADDARGVETPPAVPDDRGALSRSIAAATRSLIAAKAREELAHHPPRPAVIRRTSAIPDLRMEEPGPAGRRENWENVAGDAGVSQVPAETPRGEPPVSPRETAGPEEPPGEDEAPVFEETAPGREDAVPLTPPDTGEPAGETPPLHAAQGATPPASRSPPAADTTPPQQKVAGKTVPKGERNSLVPAVVVMVSLLLVAAGFVYLSGQDSRAGTPPVITIPTPLMTPPMTVDTPPPPATTTAVPVPEQGVWVRIRSDVYYSGQAGTMGHLQPVSGPGEKYVRVLYPARPVRVFVQKQDNTGAALTAEILRNGEVIASRSITAPMGTIELLVDPATGQPPGLPTVTPVPEGTRSGSGQLEYF